MIHVIYVPPSRPGIDVPRSNSHLIILHPSCPEGISPLLTVAPTLLTPTFQPPMDPFHLSTHKSRHNTTHDNRLPPLHRQHNARAARLSAHHLRIPRAPGLPKQVNCQQTTYQHHTPHSTRQDSPIRAVPPLTSTPLDDPIQRQRPHLDGEREALPELRLRDGLHALVLAGAGGEFPAAEVGDMRVGGGGLAAGYGSTRGEGVGSCWGEAEGVDEEGGEEEEGCGEMHFGGEDDGGEWCKSCRSSVGRSWGLTTSTSRLLPVYKSEPTLPLTKLAAPGPSLSVGWRNHCWFGPGESDWKRVETREAASHKAKLQVSQQTPGYNTGSSLSVAASFNLQLPASDHFYNGGGRRMGFETLCSEATIDDRTGNRTLEEYPWDSNSALPPAISHPPDPDELQPAVSQGRSLPGYEMDLAPLANRPSAFFPLPPPAGGHIHPGGW